MRLLLVAAATSVTGGGERHVADLLRRLPATGVEVALVCPRGGDLTRLSESLGIPVFHAPIASGLTLSGVSALRAAVKAFAPDLVHAHGSRAAFFARLADPGARDRVVYTVHGIHVDRAGSAARKTVLTGVERTLRSRTARFVCVCASDVGKGAALGVVEPQRTTVIHNGIEMPRATTAGAFRAELGVDGDVPFVLNVGRFHQQKDQATLLAAWGLVRRRVPGAVLALVGSGPLEGALRERAMALQLQESLRFVAPRADLSIAYTDANAFALSSMWEGLPYAVLEAMSFGLPVVSTDVDGIPEAVLEGVTGRLVPPADPDALAEAVVAVLSDPAGARSMGEAGKQSVERDFSLERMVDSLCELYNEVLGR